jgi:fermentation-respiration switch protein FrsA (DUF1100 family)
MQTALLIVVTASMSGYAVCAVLLLWLQGRLVYPLEKIRGVARNPAAARIPPVTVRTTDGIALPCRFAPARDAGGFSVVLFHGNGEDLSQRAQIAHDLMEAGHGVFLAEYRGYGDAPGHPTEAGLYADGRAALAYVTQHARKVVLHGYSLGSGVAVQLAAESDAIAALLLEAPFTSIADVAASRFPLVMFRWLVRDRYDNVSKIGRVRVPVLVYGGLADRVIPPALFSTLYAAIRAPARLILIDDANHADVWQRGGRESVLRFLSDLDAKA